MKKILGISIIMVVLLATVSFAQFNVSANTKIVVSAGGSFPIEGFSLKSDVGFGTCIGIEKKIGDNFAFVGAWSHTENGESSGEGIAKGDIFDARCRYYFNSLNLRFIAVNPYIVFGMGVARLDWTEDDIDPQTILGTATGLGALWKAKDDLHVFLEGEFLTGGDVVSKIIIKGGVAIPVSVF